MLPCCAIPIHVTHEVIEEFSAQIAESLLPSLVYLVDSVQWSPPIQTEVTMDKFQLRPIPWPPFSCDTVGVQYKVLLQMGCYYPDSDIVTKQFHHELSSDCLEHCLRSPVQSNWVQIFWVYTVKPFLEYISGDSLQYCFTSYGAALTVHRITWQDIILLKFLDDPFAILQKLIKLFSALSGNASLDTIKSCVVKSNYMALDMMGCWPQHAQQVTIYLQDWHVCGSDVHSGRVWPPLNTKYESLLSIGYLVAEVQSKGTLSAMFATSTSVAMCTCQYSICVSAHGSHRWLAVH
jgi:hypothetical protein